MRKIIFGFLLLSLLIAVAIPANSASAAGITTNRLDGADRFQVAVNIAQKEGWGSGGTIFLANYLAFADALSATPYAYKNKAPILLTEKDKLTQTTKDEIDQLKPSHVIIVGGPLSVSGKVIDELNGMGFKNITRIGGDDRFAVAQNIAKHMGDYKKAIVTNGLKFADSLTIAPYAARNGYPILLTFSDKVPQATMDALKGHGSPMVIGGTASVSDSVFKTINAGQRIGGADRFEVATNIIKTLGLSTNHVYVATGMKFADALTGSVLAAKENAPLLLTLTDQIPDTVKSMIYNNLIANFTVLGGLESVSDDVDSSLGVTIVIDPGHGGRDFGATTENNTVVEKNINLAVGKDVRDALADKGVQVVMTRVDDNQLTNGFNLQQPFNDADELQARVEIGEKAHGDVFVSIHSNAYKDDPTVDGTETFYHVYTSDSHTQESKSLADCIQTELISLTNMDNRRIASDGSPSDIGFHVLRENRLPSVLTELGFVTNSDDAAKLNDPTWQATAGKAIALGILDYFKKQ